MTTLFPFRPWVRRAGLSIVLVASGVTVIFALLLSSPHSRYGWVSEPFAWCYLGTLWLGGLKVWLGARKVVAEVGEERLVLRPLHQFFQKSIAWSEVAGTEQTIPGDRLILYFDGPKGVRFVALNLNLIKGRRPFLELLDRKLAEHGFTLREAAGVRAWVRPRTSGAGS